MAESTLSLAYKVLIGDVGAYLGYGIGIDNGGKTWTDRQLERILTYTRSGLCQFYWPPPASEGEQSYQWSFLKPVATLTIEAGDRFINAPDDFCGVEGPATVESSTASAQFWDVRITGEGVIRSMYMRQPGATGRPLMIGIEPLKALVPTEGQRYRLNVFPQSDGIYTLRLAYQIAPDFLSGSKPYAYGGPMHRQTLLQSCLAMAEAHGDDAVGPQRALFMERLAASISLDRALRPQRFGLNDNNSDDRYQNGIQLVRDRLNGNGVTYNGGSF